MAAPDPGQATPPPMNGSTPAAFVRRLLREQGINAFLLLGALLCFAFFARNTIEVGTIGSGGSIAAIRAGEADRKRFGTPSFIRVVPDAPLFNRDALWVPEGKYAILSFDDGTVMRAAEKTFLILRRGIGKDPSHITLLQGSIEVKPASHLFTVAEVRVETANRKVHRITDETGPEQVTADGEATKSTFAGLPKLEPVIIPSAVPPAPTTSPPAEPGPGPSASPSASPSGQPSPAPSASGARDIRLPAMVDAPRILPVPGTVFFILAAKPAEVTFGWPRPATGNLVIEDERSATVARVPLTAAPTARSILAEGHLYRWRVYAPDGSVVYGPYEISVLHFDQSTLDLILKTDPRRKAEIVH